MKALRIIHICALGFMLIMSGCGKKAAPEASTTSSEASASGQEEAVSGISSSPEAASDAVSAAPESTEAVSEAASAPAGTDVSDGITKETISFDKSWKYADESKINTGTAVLYHADPSKARGRTVCINAGHGTKGGSSVKTKCHPDGTPKVTGGTTAEGQTEAVAVSSGVDMADGSPEASATLSLAIITRDVLLDAGYDVLMIRETDDVQLDNVARTVMANNLADCHIALHYDYTDTDKGAFFMSVPSSETYRNMEPVKSHWQEHMALGRAVVSGLKAEGLKLFEGGELEMDLTQTSYSTVPSIDLECGDTVSDISEKAQGIVAQGILAGIEEFFKGK